MAQPIAVTIVQPERETWRFVCSFRSKEYSEEDVQRPFSMDFSRFGWVSRGFKAL